MINEDADLFLKVINEIQQLKQEIIEENIFKKFYLNKQK